MVTESREVIAAIYWRTDLHSYYDIFDTTVYAELIRISPEGEMDLSKTFRRRGDTTYHIHNISRAMQPGYFIGTGSKNVINNQKATAYTWVFQFDRNFPILWETIIDTSDCPIQSMMVEHWDSTYFLCTYQDRSYMPGECEYYTFYAMDMSGNLLLKKNTT